ncbi:N-acetyl-alpha-D-glucosaminyl L-malate synthase BshA [Enterococcus faecium]|nr:N-acetyl-alpha-D-glucosaminyl L-malate synthase BshA [Enterococcus faecium]
MKIAILSPAFSMGGASIVASKIAKGLIDSGHEVFFVSYLESEKTTSRI